jgi:RNA polymerase sigma-70 factor (ECF subfamily)
MSRRDNEAWVTDLRAGGESREAALGDLHDLLRSHLPYGLSRWLSPGDPQFDTLLEDVIQDTLMRILEALDMFEGRSQFTTWAYKIAVRLALMELRRRRWKDVSLEELTEEKEDRGAWAGRISASEVSPESGVERQDMMARIQRILEEELPPKQRQALMAVAVHGVPMDEVARRMNTNRNALYKLMHDARLQLKRRLEAEGLRVEDVLASFESK